MFVARLKLFGLLFTAYPLVSYWLPATAIARDFLRLYLITPESHSSEQPKPLIHPLILLRGAVHGRRGISVDHENGK